jgi:epoxyqueuosine reductase
MFSRKCALESINDISMAVALPTHHVVLQIPITMQAGPGEQGRNGLLITPEFGPRVKIGSLVTDLPMVADLPINFGVTKFCITCEQCARMCPAQALPMAIELPN